MRPALNGERIGGAIIFTGESMKAAMIFPGQGAQSVGMLDAWAEDNPIVRSVFKDASDVLGYDLWEVVSEGPAEKLNQTEVTQPALLAAGVAAWSSWLAEDGPQPAVMAGHSLGEYTALVAAGAIGFADAVAIVAERGRLMQAALPAGEGAMAAILGLDDATIREVCEQAAGDEVCEPVNFNSPGQVVIAGNAAAVERAGESAKEAGAKRVVPLPVSVPSHCALMREAADKLGEALAEIEISAPNIPVLHNVDGQARQEPAAIREALVAQLYSPVLWVDTIKNMQGDGVEALVELGPGKVLTGLARRIDRKLKAFPVYDDKTLKKALGELQE